MSTVLIRRVMKKYCGWQTPLAYFVADNTRTLAEVTSKLSLHFFDFIQRSWGSRLVN